MLCVNTPVVERFDPLLSFASAEASRVVELEEGRGKFHQPFWVDGCGLAHVLLGSEHQLVVDHPGGRRRGRGEEVGGAIEPHPPVRLPVEQSTGGVDEDGLVVNDCLVAFLGVLYRRSEMRHMRVT